MTEAELKKKEKELEAQAKALEEKAGELSTQEETLKTKEGELTTQAKALEEKEKSISGNLSEEEKLVAARKTVADAEASIEAERQKKLKELKKPRKFVPGKYLCYEKCFHNGYMYNENDIETFSVDFPAPLSKPDEDGVQYVRHFSLIED